MQAFLNKQSHKDEVLARLHHHEARGLLVPGGARWNGDSGTVVGCILQSDDLALWESEQGLPRWLALLLDGLGNAVPAHQVEEMAARTLEAVPLGADLQSMGSAMLLYFLVDSTGGLALVAQEAGLEDLLQEIAEAHRLCVAGTAPDAEQWSGLRKRALQRSDALLSGAVAHAVGLCLEAACWDPKSSPATVIDTWRCWMNVREMQAARDIGWVAEIDHARTKAEFDALYAKAMLDDPTASVDVFKLYAQAEPEKYAKLQLKQDREYEARSAAIEACAMILQTVVGKAGAPEIEV
jgi:hypothetical protein